MPGLFDAAVGLVGIEAPGSLALTEPEIPPKHDCRDTVRMLAYLVERPTGGVDVLKPSEFAVLLSLFDHRINLRDLPGLLKLGQSMAANPRHSAEPCVSASTV